MLIYNFLTDLFAIQVFFLILVIAMISLVIIRATFEISIGKVLLIILNGLFFTFMSLSIGYGNYGGTLYHEYFGWPVSFFSVSRNIGIDIEPAIPIPFNSQFYWLKFVANVIVYTFISILFYAFLKNTKNAKDKKLIFYNFIALISVITLLFGLSFYNKYQEDLRNKEMKIPSISTSDYSFTKDQAKDILLSRYPGISKGLKTGLPPQILYFSRRDDSWLIVHTLEGSGVLQIFEAFCYKVTEDGSVFELGHYKYEQYMSYILQDINDLDEETCQIR